MNAHQKNDRIKPEIDRNSDTPIASYFRFKCEITVHELGESLSAARHISYLYVAISSKKEKRRKTKGDEKKKKKKKKKKTAKSYKQKS
jgi:hypothetical protein